MNDTVQNFNDEIEIERMKVTTEQGSFIFFVSLGFSIIFIVILWDLANHLLLLLWMSTLNFNNLVRWINFRKYKTQHSAFNPKKVSSFKVILFVSSLISGLCWGAASILFIDPAEPNTLLILSVSIFFVSTSTILSLFSYLPAVIAFIIPAGGILTALLLLQGNNAIFNLGLVIAVTLVVSIVGCIKIGRSFNSALHLNFENASLRRDSEEKSMLLVTALNNIDQGICMSDKDDRLRMWNWQFINLLGSKGNKVEPDINLETILNTANPPLIAHPESKTEYHLEDGRVFEIRQNQIYNGGRVLTFTDISDAIEREQALEQARKIAEQANAAKTRFLAAASHDLRQPIHALGLFFTELSDRVKSPETELLINQVNDSISAINSMLNALLDVSKLDAGVIKPNIESFKLATLFERLKIEFIPIAHENHNKLRIHQTSVAVKSDPAMLERILRNLIGNALRYTKNGRVLVTARPRNENIQIQVFDNGLGIPEDQLDQVFIEFHRLENPARERQQGLGLGLAIVKRLASLLDHKITVASNVGCGSCFSITLPVTHVIDAIPNRRIKERVQPHSIENRQILVLDDDTAVLESVNGLLTHWGCQVITASSQAEAFDKLEGKQIKPELLIVDYRLPGNLSGIEIAKNLQNRLAYPTSVLIITGDTESERLREASMSNYPLLHKPVQPAKLRSTIQYLFSKLN